MSYVSSDDHSRIEDLKKSLYSRNAPDVRTRRKLRFTDRNFDVNTAWDKQEEPSGELMVLNKQYEDHSMSFFGKLLIFSAIFCILAVGIGAYIFFQGANLISGDNIDIKVSGPVSIPGGAPVSFDISVHNKNNIELELADLSVEFPDGTVDTRDPSKELRNFRELIGDIPAGGKAVKTISAIIFGEENFQKSIIVGVTYKVKGSSSVFTKKTSYDILINSSPINLTTSAFNEITSGQEFDMTITLKSNSQETLRNVLMRAEYPFGFNFVSSNLEPISSNTVWRVGDIPPGGERKITIKGSVTGEDSDSRVFRFYAGAQSSSDPRIIGTQYMSTEKEISIQKPFISMVISIDNDSSSDDYIGQYNSTQRVQIEWFNNLSVPITNAIITAKLSGTAYEKTTVQPNMGYYQSVSDQIVWNRQTNPELANIPVGGSGRVSFSITPKDKSTQNNPIINPILKYTVDVSATRPQESNVPSALRSIVSRTVKITSNVALTGRVVRSVGPFVNTGPIPPKADQVTTYTVILTVDNTSNAVNGAKVVTSIPAHVKWLGKVSPTTEDVVYDENSGEIVWNIGNVSTYTAGSARRKELLFQVSLQPSITQVGHTPTLINEMMLTAVDTFTGKQLQSSQDYLTTRFSTDPSYIEGQGSVVQ